MSALYSSIENTLQKCCSTEWKTRNDSYEELIRKLEGKQIAWNRVTNVKTIAGLLSAFKTDIGTIGEHSSLNAIKLLGYLVSQEEFIDLISEEMELEAFKMLFKLLELDNKEQESIVEGSLDVIAKSKFHLEIYEQYRDKLLKLLKNILASSPTDDVIIKTLYVYRTLIETIQQPMFDAIELWFSPAFPHLVHDNDTVRNLAYILFKCCHTHFEQSTSARSAKRIQFEVQGVIGVIRGPICKQMIKLVSDSNLDIFKVWRLVIALLGKDLHPGTSLINSLMEILTKGLKGNVESKIETLKCWQGLIDNFALDSKVILHPRRLKLLMLMLKPSNAKTEDVAKVLLNVWWHLIDKLGDQIGPHYELVVTPLLRYIFCQPANNRSNSMGGLADKIFKNTNYTSPGRKFPGLVVSNVEILSQIISTGLPASSHDYNCTAVKSLSTPVLTPSVFVRHYGLLCESTRFALESLDSSNHRQLALGTSIFHSLLQRCIELVNNETLKKESTEPIKELIKIVLYLEEQSPTFESPNNFVYKAIDLLVCGSSSLPTSVLNTSQYYVSANPNASARDLMNGTLCNSLICLLCRPSLLYFACNKEAYFTLFSEVLRKSGSNTGKLSFIQDVLQQLSSTIPHLTNKIDVPVRMWSQIVKELVDYISKTQQISDGDTVEHNWQCIYDVLMFPIQLSFNEIQNDNLYLTILQDWGKLWSKFTELTPLAMTAEPSSECDYMSRNILEMAREKFVGPPDLHQYGYLLISEVLSLVVDSIRFAQLGKVSMKLINSPAKPKKKPRDLHNLATTLDLISFIFPRCLRITSQERNRINSKLCDIVIKILDSTNQIKLSWPLISNLIEPLRETIDINPSAKYLPNTEKKILEMWEKYCQYIEKHIGMKISADQFTKLAPILTRGLNSSNESLQKSTRKLWISCFSSITHPIPSSLHYVLQTAKLPPVSMLDGDSSILDLEEITTKENIPNFLSGSKLGQDINVPKDSFSSPKSVNSINQATPKRKLLSVGSPLRSKKKIDLVDMSEKEFTKISSPKTSKRFLTKHQMEKLSERPTDIPAMYNDLSQSLSQSQRPLPEFVTLNSFDEESKLVDKSAKKDDIDPSDLTFSNKFVNVEKETVIDKSVDSNSAKKPDEEIVVLQTPLKTVDEDAVSITSNNSTSSLKQNEKLEEKDSSRRKCPTPAKKTIFDIRKSLKRKNSSCKKPSKKRNMLETTDMDESMNESILENENNSRIESESLQEMAQSLTDSDDDIVPSSQDLTPSSFAFSKESKSYSKKSNVESVEKSKWNRFVESISSGDKNNDTPNSKDKEAKNTNKKETPLVTRVSSSSISSLDEDSNQSKSSTSEKKKSKSMTSYETPSKITRSGRKIVQPSKDMPTPMTPPNNNKSTEKKSQTPTDSERKSLGSSVSKTSLTKSMSKSVQKTITDIFGKKSKKEDTSEDMLPELDENAELDCVISINKAKPPSNDESNSTVINDSTSNVSKDDSTSNISNDDSTSNISNDGYTSNISSEKSKIEKTEKDIKSPKATRGRKKKDLDKRRRSLRSSTANEDLAVLPDSTRKKRNNRGSTESLQEREEIEVIVEPPVKKAIEKPIESNVDKEIEKHEDIEDNIIDKEKEVLNANNSIESKTDKPDEEKSTETELNKDESSSNENEKDQMEVESEEINFEENVTTNTNENNANQKDSSDNEIIEINNDPEINIQRDKLNIDSEPDTETKKKSTEETDLNECSEQNTTEENLENVVKESTDKVEIQLGELEPDSNSTKEPISHVEELVISSGCDSDVNTSIDMDNVEDPPVGKEPEKGTEENMDIEEPSIESIPQKQNDSVTNQTKDNLVTSEFCAEGKSGLTPEETGVLEPVPIALDEDMALTNLASTVGTPERKKQGIKKLPGSRAAMMLACAKRNMKIRENNDGESPSKAVNKSVGEGASPVGKKGYNLSSPGCTPPNRKRKFTDLEVEKPWAKHEPSPQASPSTGILKKTCDYNQGETSPPNKQRRVSFADPPVSEQVEIPPSPKTIKSLKAQKRLDMTQADTITKSKHVDLTLTEDDQCKTDENNPDNTKPIFQELEKCSLPVSKLATHLTSPKLIEKFMSEIKTKKIKTIGDFCKLTETDILALPIKSPKISNTKKALKSFSDMEISNEVVLTPTNEIEEVNVDDIEEPINVEEIRKISEAEELGLQYIDDTEEVQGKILENGVAEKISHLASSGKEEIGTEVFTNLVSSLSTDNKRKLLDALLSEMEYKSVIDLYHNYLTNVKLK